MTAHWHVSLENVMVYGLSAIVVIWSLRALAGVLVTNPRTEIFGKSLGAVVNFS